MLFSSLEFLYLFLPLTAILYFLSPNGAKNYVLLAASLIFYGIAQPKYLPLLLAVALADYGFGSLIYREMAKANQRRANAILTVAVLLNVLVLFAFKYLDAFLRLLGFSPLGIELPPGISFYIFQALSYVCDVRRRTSEVQKNPFLFVTYVSLFPQLVAGPIVRYSDIDASIKSRRHSFDKCAEGIRIFAVGLAKKLLLANGAGECYERMVRYSTVGNGTVLGAWLGIIFFAFQIYFDFSAYSDMARGLGKIFGFEFPENFNYPYISRSITEFWRRWHITLSSWFREYVYIPLGGNRRGKARTYLNLLVVWLLTGIWHGAGFNFLMWGLYFFALLVIEKAFLLRLLKRLPPFFGRTYALFFILVGWLIFESGQSMSYAESLTYFGQMLGVGCSFISEDALLELTRNLPYLCVMAVGATPIPKRIFQALEKKKVTPCRILANSAAMLSIVICTCYLADSGYNPFLYFRF